MVEAQRDEPDRLSSDDIRTMNRAAVERSAAISRLVGATLVGLGAIVCLGWAWGEARAQQRAGGAVFTFGDATTSNGLDLLDRIDLFVSSLGLLLTAGVAVAGGMALRLLADYSQTRVGGTVTGFTEGDPLPDAGDNEDA